MSASESRPPCNPVRAIRRDGWTTERQLRFLAALERTSSVSEAAADAGMSRESAYRLRCRAGLFAALWDCILQPDFAVSRESHMDSWTAGRLMRVFGTHFRGNAAISTESAAADAKLGKGDRTRTS